MPLIRSCAEVFATGGVEDDHPLGRVDEIQKLGPFDDVDHAAEVAMRVGGDAEKLFASAAGVEVFEQADDLAGNRLGKRLDAGQAGADVPVRARPAARGR